MLKFDCILLTLCLTFPSISQAQSDWTGIWVTERGVFELTQSGNNVKGKVNKSGNISGTLSDGKFAYNYTNGRDSASGILELAEDGASCTGNYKTQYQSGNLSGWRKSESIDSETFDYGGVWLTSLGTLVLSQDGNTVNGSIGPEGWSSVKTGTVTGKRMEFDWIIRNFNGKGWFEVTADGQRLYGVMNPDTDPSPWVGIRPEGYEQDAKAKAGEIVKGIADNGMLYNLRMPDDWKEGDKVDVVVLFHGSNWTTNGMVWVTAKNWPEIGKKFAILGIQGQSWAKWSKADDLRFNYTYINWVGRSTLGGYPYTDRESPYLVGQLLDEFKTKLNLKRVFVGGHSQGGYLTYVMHMHFPEKIDGTFPMAGGMIYQAEPDAFDDEELMLAQRETPMYILHGKQDNVVGVSSGQYAYNRFLAHDFDRVQLSTPSRGHPYDFLPVDKAIKWLDMMSTEDKDALAKFGLAQVKLKKWRNVGMVIERAKEIGGGKEFSPIWKAYKTNAEKEAKKILKLVKQNSNGKWIDKYYEFRANFGLSDKAADVIAAFEYIRKEHQKPADKLKTDARKDFQNRSEDAAYQKYQQIVDKFYASTHYLTVKKSLDDRK